MAGRSCQEAARAVSQLLERTRGFDHYITERTVDVHVMNLRKKIEPDPRRPVCLVSAVCRRTALPDAALEAVRTVLRGEAVVSADDAFTVERSVSHGDAAVGCVMAGQPGLRELLGPACAERDIAYALIVSRAVRVGCQNLCRASDLGF